MEALRKEEPNNYTYADYAAWDLKEGERYEIIDGVPYMLAAPLITHQNVSTRLCGEIYNFLKGRRCQVFHAPFDVCLFGKGDDDKTVVQPDITVVCDKDKLKDGKRCNGAPDIIIEVLSPSTASRDWFVKLNKYFGAGVREYWIVDPEVQKVFVHLLKDGSDKYETIEYNKDDTIEVNVLDGCNIDLKTVFTE